MVGGALRPVRLLRHPRRLLRRRRRREVLLRLPSLPRDPRQRRRSKSRGPDGRHLAGQARGVATDDPGEKEKRLRFAVVGRHASQAQASRSFRTEHNGLFKRDRALTTPPSAA